MPMTGPVDLFATTRTPPLDDEASLAPAIADPLAVIEQHRDAFGRLEAAGVTWLVVTGSAVSRAVSLEFIAAFGATYLDR
jgi:hypothetical protein